MAALVRIPGVPIAAVGTWNASTGVWECTAEQLRDAVIAQHDPAFRTPILKLGHLDPRFTDGEPFGDGEPAVGRLESLRLAPDGQTLLADLVGVPAWLGEVMATAYPSRSVEAIQDVETSDGARYALVVTGLALLGVHAPSIESLGDIATLFGQSTDVETWTAASRVAASALPPMEDPDMPTIQRRPLGQVVLASASIDELTRAAEEWAETQPLIGRSCYVRDIYTDSIIMTVWVGDDSRYYRCSWSEAGGVFTFGTPEPVRPAYVPVDEGQGGGTAPIGVAASTPVDMVRHYQQKWTGVASSGRGRDLSAAAGSPTEEKLSISSAIAEALGVAADADEETVLAAVESMRQPAPQPTDPTTGGTGEPTVTDPATQPSQADVERLVAAAVDRRLAAAQAPILASLTSATAELAGLKAERVAAEKTAVIAGAVTAGKIRPADRPVWESQYDAAPDVVTAILAATAPGTAVPVSSVGHAEDGQAGSEAFSDADYAAIFGKAGAV